MKNESNRIEVFVRVRPALKGKATFYGADELEKSIEFKVPKDLQRDVINNKKEEYTFKFDSVFDQKTTQETIFDKVAKKACLSSLDGYNATVFAYGQTGSGKTYTVTGGPESYNDRGIIPRTLELVFSELEKRREEKYTVAISYMQIYNNSGYDLLEEQAETAQGLEGLPRISLREDGDGNFHLSNLRPRIATTVEEALNLLFIGDTNRMIAETPMNLASSRSHCIFTINLQSHRPGTDVVRRSKLHLVDLAGSERVHKTNSDGKILQEAKYINLSLHFLEQVIVTLQERSEGKKIEHVPYRNSFMTSVLRDSLGGNCRTAMIANIAPENDSLDESISTCRFAQRVACVKNVAMINEETDPKLLIRRLKAENRALKEELAILRGEMDAKPLTEDDIAGLRELVQNYLDDEDPKARLEVGEFVKVQACYGIFKDLVLAGGGPKSDDDLSSEAAKKLKEQLRTLQYQIQLRDNEIQILVNLLHKRKAGGGGGEGGDPVPVSSSPAHSARRGSTELMESAAASIAASISQAQPQAHGGTGAPGGAGASTAANGGKLISPKRTDQHRELVSRLMDEPVLKLTDLRQGDVEDLMKTDLLLDRTRAFEVFRRSYRKQEALAERKAELKRQYDAAQTLGNTINTQRKKIAGLKQQMIRHEQARAAQELAKREAGEVLSPTKESDAEAHVRKELEKENAEYLSLIAKLRDLKKQIDFQHNTLEQSRIRLNKDFNDWHEAMMRQRARTKRDGVLPEQDSTRTPVNSSLKTTSFDMRASATSSGVPSTSGSSGGSSRVAPPAGHVSKKLDPLTLAEAQKYNVPMSVLTGNKDADAQLIAFYKAKNNR